MTDKMKRTLHVLSAAKAISGSSSFGADEPGNVEGRGSSNDLLERSGSAGTKGTSGDALDVVEKKMSQLMGGKHLTAIN